MKIIIGTKNIKKAQLVLSVFQNEFANEQITLENIDINSDVPNTPWEEQTYNGAINRAKNLSTSNVDYDYYIGLETGLAERYGNLFEEAWCCILDKQGRKFIGFSSGYVIDNKLKTRVQKDEVTDTKILEIFDLQSNEFVMYSGNPDVRATSLKNAVSATVANLKTVI